MELCLVDLTLKNYTAETPFVTSQLRIRKIYYGGFDVYGKMRTNECRIECDKVECMHQTCEMHRAKINSKTITL